MRVITKGRESIARIWAQPIISGLSYRMIRYHILAECKDGALLLNTVTGELVLLNNAEIALIRRLPALYHSGMDELIEHHFLVPREYDEAKSVNQLRVVLRRMTNTGSITGYSILLTSACNARCFYCFESGYPRHTMSRETADAVIDYIVKHRNDEDKIFIQWFGGEPTLGEERIDQICDGLIAQGINYTTYTISNGYLFTKEMAHKAKEKWKLKNIQITLDGTEEIYNTVKAYVNVKDNPYRRVLNNIGFLLDEGIRVIVRMNLDFHNIHDIKALIDDLADRFAGKPNFSAYVHELFENEGSQPVMHNEEERKALISSVISLNNYIIEKGCNRARTKSEQQDLPSIKIPFCMADNPGSLLINPLGQLGKCDHFSFERLVGDMERGHDFQSRYGTFWLNPTFTGFCEECAMFPSCGMMDNCPAKKDCFPEQISEKVDMARRQMLYRYNGFVVSAQNDVKEDIPNEKT